MPDTRADSGREKVIALLADHLCRTGVVRWPGADGMTIEDVVFAAYRTAVAAGHLPSPADLAEQHPSLADDIRRHFSAGPDEGGPPADAQVNRGGLEGPECLEIAAVG